MYYQLCQFTYKLIKKKLQISKVVYFAKKNTRFSKNSLKFFLFFSSKRDNWVYRTYIYIYVLNAMITSNLLYL